MCAGPVLVMRSISWMIEELVIVDDYEQSWLIQTLSGNIRNDALAGTRYEIQSQLLHARRTGKGNARFPWIQNNDPDCFQSLNIVPSINQVAVPS